MSDNVAGALCYVLGFITGILFLVLEPYNRSPFVRFHAFQSIFFNVAFIGVWIVEGVFTSILPFSLMMISALLWFVVSLGTLAVVVWLIIQAYQGKRFKLPLIGDLAERQV